MPENSMLPLWFGTATIEMAKHAAHIGSLPRTKGDFVTPRRLLSKDAGNEHVVSVGDNSNELVVLLW